MGLLVHVLVDSDPYVKSHDCSFPFHAEVAMIAGGGEGRKDIDFLFSQPSVRESFGASGKVVVGQVTEGKDYEGVTHSFQLCFEVWDTVVHYYALKVHFGGVPPLGSLFTLVYTLACTNA